MLHYAFKNDEKDDIIVTTTGCGCCATELSYKYEPNEVNNQLDQMVCNYVEACQLLNVDPVQLVVDKLESM